jgi:hypothetical protein
MLAFRHTWDITKQTIPTLMLIIPLYCNMHKSHLVDDLQANRLQGVRTITLPDMTITAHKRHETLVNFYLHLQGLIVLYTTALELHLLRSTKRPPDTKTKRPIIHKQIIEAIKAEKTSIYGHEPIIPFHYFTSTLYFVGSSGMIPTPPCNR